MGCTESQEQKPPPQAACAPASKEAPTPTAQKERASVDATPEQAVSTEQTTKSAQIADDAPRPTATLSPSNKSPRRRQSQMPLRQLQGKERERGVDSPSAKQRIRLASLPDISQNSFSSRMDPSPRRHSTSAHAHSPSSRTTNNPVPDMLLSAQSMTFDFEPLGMSDSESDGGFAVEDLLRKIDRGHYATAQRHLTTTAADPTACGPSEYAMALLGLAVLQNLHYPEWPQPASVSTCDPGVVSDAERVLEGMGHKSPSAYLALAELELARSQGAMTDKVRSHRTKAATYPLGKLVNSTQKLLEVRSMFEGGRINEEQYAEKVEREVDVLEDLSFEEDVMASPKAAKTIWHMYYKGIYPINRDLQKARSLLDVVVRGSRPGPAREQYEKKLARIESKIGGDMSGRRQSLRRASATPRRESSYSITPRRASAASPRHESGLRRKSSAHSTSMASLSLSIVDNRRASLATHQSEGSLLSPRGRPSVSAYTHDDLDDNEVAVPVDPPSPQDLRRGPSKRVKKRGATIARRMRENDDGVH